MFFSCAVTQLCNMVSENSSLAHLWPQIAPTQLPHGPTWPQLGPNMLQYSVHTHNGPTWPPHGSACQDVPTMSQLCPNIAPSLRIAPTLPYIARPNVHLGLGSTRHKVSWFSPQRNDENDEDDELNPSPGVKAVFHTALFRTWPQQCLHKPHMATAPHFPPSGAGCRKWVRFFLSYCLS